MVTASEIVAFSSSIYGTKFEKTPGAVNIVYLEGCTAADLTPNPDLPDLWNDTSSIIQFDASGLAFFAHKAEATSEPGLSATMSARSARLGGVFRIAIGFQEEKWIRGFHKGDPLHPALVQVAPITGHRDRNRDGKRTADPITDDVRGLNHHGTRPGIRPVRVGGFSFACQVRRMWEEHLQFMALCDADPRYIDSKRFRYSSTTVDHSNFWKWKSNQAV
jgi:hypothetical protein